MNSLRRGIFFIASLMLSTMTNAETLDFANAQTTAQMWVVNDGVMGGVSESRFRHDAEGVMIEGLVSLENNGGFASVRSAAAFGAGTVALELKIKGDGKRYKFILRTDASPRSPMYQADFVAAEGWHTYRFVPSDFKASFRGRAVDAPELVFADAKELGILIADKQAGSFRVQLQTVRALTAVNDSK
jgi:NADH dehydrogenase [ubiquinone] 1 alpha subcomplex assembly factor 1